MCVNVFSGGDKMLDKKGVAELLKVHPNTVDNLIKKGMPSYKVGRNRRFDGEEVVEWYKKEGSEKVD